MKKLFISFYLFLWPFYFYTQAQNPPSILWKCIQSENFKIIFPSEIEADAQRIANTIEWANKNDTKTLHIKPKPISLILNSRSMNSNAFAALGPRRMEWYLNPPQSVTGTGSIDWAQTLSIHEYRHVVQYAKNNQHFTKFMSFLYGDIGQGMMQWSIPDWFFEGDAVTMETALTKGGRGRMPEFDMNIRAFALNNEKYTYDQAYLGSYRRYYPSYYNLGYPMVAYARINYGSDIWDKVLERTSKISFWPYAFGNSIKKYTQLNASKLYKSTIADLKGKWENDAKTLKITDVKIINKKKKHNWTNYYNPKYDSNGNIICIKSDLSKIPSFYEVSGEGKEKKLKNTDAGIFQVKNEKIIWERTIPDIRWDEQEFSDIIIYDLKTKQQKRITFKKKYVSPTLSPDGKMIAVVEHNPEQKNSLCIIDAINGNELKTFQFDDNDYIRTPVWSEDGKMIAFMLAKYKGTALSVLEIESGKTNKIIDFNFDNIGRPVFYNHYILYNSPYSGIGNIFAVDIQTGQKYQITSRPYGAYSADVSPDKSKIVFQDYNKNGFDIAEMPLKPENWIKIEEIKPTEQHYYKTLVEQEGNKSIDEAQIQEKTYPVTKYNKFKDAVKIHSWGFFPYSPNLEFTIYSNNYLNTLAIQSGYIYNINEQTNTGYLGVSYSKYFPVFSVVSSYGQRKESYLNNNTIVNDAWTESVNNFSVSFPFNLSRNVWKTTLNIKGSYSYTYTMNKGGYRYLSDPWNGAFYVLGSGISFSNSMQYAWRDFNPKWAQLFAFDYKQIPTSTVYRGYLVSARGNLYFPGLLPQNSLKLGGYYEKQKSLMQNETYLYYFPSLFAFPRGYKAYTYDEIYKLSADYQFPLWYPDISIGPLAYIKRIRAGAFVDYGKGYWGNTQNNFNSYGGSIIFEFNLFRYNYPFEVGIQFAYKPTYPAGEKQTDISILIFGLPF